MQLRTSCKILPTPLAPPSTILVRVCTLRRSSNAFFRSKSGHHDTTVHEVVAPAVTKETIEQHRHEQIQTAVDKEVHQDHYHTSVQPVVDKQVLPEQHHHNLGAVEHRQFEHDRPEDVQARLQAEAAKFKDTTIRGDTKHTSSAAPTIAGEHIHHHVHEQIQPVINRQTIEPHVVHTTVPIHEVHHNASQHHSTTALPAVSMADFKKQGGVLTGREERYDGFEGEPRSMIGGSSTSTSGLTTGTTGTHGTHGTHGTGVTGKAENLAERELSGGRHGTTGTSSTTGTTGLGSSTTGSSTTGTHGSGLTGKAENFADREIAGRGTGSYGNTAGSGVMGSTTGSSTTGTTGTHGST